MGNAKANYGNEILLENVEKGKEKNSSGKTSNPLSESTKRPRLERYIDILKVVSEFSPMKRSHILHRANLEWSELNIFLQNLEEAESVSKSITKNGIRYEITEIGKKILEDYAKVQSSLHKIGPEASINFCGFRRTNL